MFDLAEVGGRDGKGGSEIGLFHAALLAQRFETSACENAVAGHDILLLSPCGRGYGGLAAQPLSRRWRGGGRQPPPPRLARRQGAKPSHSLPQGERETPYFANYHFA